MRARRGGRGGLDAQGEVARAILEGRLTRSEAVRELGVSAGSRRRLAAAARTPVRFPTLAHLAKAVHASPRTLVVCMKTTSASAGGALA
jgi:hypothetical protein